MLLLKPMYQKISKTCKVRQPPSCLQCSNRCKQTHQQESVAPTNRHHASSDINPQHDALILDISFLQVPIYLITTLQSPPSTWPSPQYPHEHDLPAVLAMPPPAPPHQLLLRLGNYWGSFSLIWKLLTSHLLTSQHQHLRHASQSSLDESSQKLAPRATEPRRPPYRNPSHPTKVDFTRDWD